MGSTASKVTKMQTSDSQSTSNGFHMLEIHAPTLGLGFLSIIIMGTILVSCLCFYRRWHLQQHRRRRQRDVERQRQANFNSAVPDLRALLQGLTFRPPRQLQEPPRFAELPREDQPAGPNNAGPNNTGPINAGSNANINSNTRSNEDDSRRLRTWNENDY